MRTPEPEELVKDKLLGLDRCNGECLDFGHDACKAKSGFPSMLLCTKNVGHDGPHIACGGDMHNMKIWYD